MGYEVQVHKAKRVRQFAENLSSDDRFYQRFSALKSNCDTKISIRPHVIYEVV